MGRHRRNRITRWGDEWPTWPDPTRCNCCGDPQPVARYGMAPVCARCYDRWIMTLYESTQIEAVRAARMAE